MAVGALGTDTSGSSAFLHHFVGFSVSKPTYGRVSKGHGVMPLRCPSIDHVRGQLRELLGTRPLLQFTLLASDTLMNQHSRPLPVPAFTSKEYLRLSTSRENLLWVPQDTFTF